MLGFTAVLVLFSKTMPKINKPTIFGSESIIRNLAKAGRVSSLVYLMLWNSSSCSAVSFVKMMYMLDSAPSAGSSLLNKKYL